MADPFYNKWIKPGAILLIITGLQSIGFLAEDRISIATNTKKDNFPFSPGGCVAISSIPKIIVGLLLIFSFTHKYSSTQKHFGLVMGCCSVWVLGDIFFLSFHEDLGDDDGENNHIWGESMYFLVTGILFAIYSIYIAYKLTNTGLESERESFFKRWSQPAAHAIIAKGVLELLHFFLRVWATYGYDHDDYKYKEYFFYTLFLGIGQIIEGLIARRENVGKSKMDALITSIITLGIDQALVNSAFLLNRYVALYVCTEFLIGDLMLLSIFLNWISIKENEEGLKRNPNEHHSLYFNWMRPFAFVFIVVGAFMTWEGILGLYGNIMSLSDKNTDEKYKVYVGSILKQMYCAYVGTESITLGLILIAAGKFKSVCSAWFFNIGAFLIIVFIFFMSLQQLFVAFDPPSDMQVFGEEAEYSGGGIYSNVYAVLVTIVVLALLIKNHLLLKKGEIKMNENTFENKWIKPLTWAFYSLSAICLWSFLLNDLVLFGNDLENFMESRKYMFCYRGLKFIFHLAAATLFHLSKTKKVLLPAIGIGLEGILLLFSIGVYANYYDKSAVRQISEGFVNFCAIDFFFFIEQILVFFGTTFAFLVLHFGRNEFKTFSIQMKLH
eukprot:TRINITY_DN920_c0_g1_i1.p1 TRINITY_DN920_c0_g1~~TRINITY_DN920_c0_g1_i1.p1  ORF type:complete len:610 (-),score=36.93 TRINITY_DN920_c0_g1_i1:11-1840(-)